MRLPVHTAGAVAVALATGPLVVTGGCLVTPFRTYRAEELTGGALVVKDIPLVRQEDKRTCGFAVTAMLSKYHDIPIREQDLARVRLAALADDVSGRLLREVLEGNGFEVYIFPGNLLDEETPRGVAYHLAQGRPVVVMISPRGKRDHYLVVSGLDASREHVFCEDPGRGRVACSAKAFLPMWERSGRFTLVAVPRRETLPVEPGATRPAKGR